MDRRLVSPRGFPSLRWLLALALLGSSFSGRAGAAVQPGALVVVSEGYQALLKVDPNTGYVSVISGCFVTVACASDFGLRAPVGQGPQLWFSNSGSPDVNAAGQIVVCGYTGGAPPVYGIFVIDSDTGNRSFLPTRETCNGVALVHREVAPGAAVGAPER